MSKDNSQGSGDVSTGDASNDAYCGGDNGGFDTCTSAGEHGNEKSDQPS